LDVKVLESRNDIENNDPIFGKKYRRLLNDEIIEETDQTAYRSKSERWHKLHPDDIPFIVGKTVEDAKRYGWLGKIISKEKRMNCNNDGFWISDPNVRFKRCPGR
jgi:hypothetical protein